MGCGRVCAIIAVPHVQGQRLRVSVLGMAEPIKQDFTPKPLDFLCWDRQPPLPSPAVTFSPMSGNGSETAGSQPTLRWLGEGVSCAASVSHGKEKKPHRTEITRPPHPGASSLSEDC